MAQHWINSGKVEKVVRPTPVPKTIPILPLNEAIARVCGKNVHQLEWCFLSAEKDPEKSQMRYEDFLRNLTEGKRTGMRCVSPRHAGHIMSLTLLSTQHYYICSFTTHTPSFSVLSVF